MHTVMAYIALVFWLLSGIFLLFGSGDSKASDQAAHAARGAILFMLLAIYQLELSLVPG